MKYIRIEVRDMTHDGDTLVKAFVGHVAENRIQDLLSRFSEAAHSMTGVQFEPVPDSHPAAKLEKPAD